MYLNNERGNTNIDNQFSNKKSLFENINFQKIKLPLIIGGAILLLLIIGLIVFSVIGKRTRYFITLDGEEKLTIYQGSTYVEAGYKGFDNHNNDLTDQVIIENNLDTANIGTYEIVYKLNNVTKKRIITIIEQGEGTTVIHLQGDVNLVLSIGQVYQEPGYRAIDSVDSDITSQVKISNNIDSSKAGVYRVVYTVTNSSGITTTKTRTVIVK